MVMKILRINLSKSAGAFEEIKSDYNSLGGRGLTSQIIADEVEPHCEALGAGNKIILAPGLLGGTRAPGSGRLSIGGKSPLTGTIKESNVGGTAGQKIAKLGIKAIIIEGEALDWSYLRIDADGVTILPATDLKGKTTYEASASLREQYGENASVIVIGPAGESLFNSASVAVTDMEGRPARHAGRGGLGAVLGSKKIKAVVISEHNLPLRQLGEVFNNAAKQFAEGLINNPVSGGALPTFGTAVLVNMVNASGALPTHNFQQGQFDGAEAICGEKLAENVKSRGGQCGHPCQPGCVIRCSNIYPGINGEHLTSGLEYETIAMFGSNCGIENLDVVAQLDRLCDEYGIDTIETGCGIAVAMEAGVFPFGDGEGAIDLVKQIGAGTYLGRILGQGAATTGKVFGVKRVPAVKGQSLAAYDPRAIKANGVLYATSPMGADHTCGNALGHPAVNPLSTEGQAEVSRELQTICAGLDNTGLCLFSIFALGENPENMNLVGQMAGIACGEDWNADNIIKLGLNTLGVERRFNQAAGFTQAHDRLPEFFYSEPLAPHNSVFDVPEQELAKVY